MSLEAAPEPWPPLRGVLRVSLPAHAALPLALWLAHRDVSTTAWAVVGLHVLGAAALVATARWWWGRAVELLVVLTLDHVVTFGVGSLLLP